MTWAFLETMKQEANPSYAQVSFFYVSVGVVPFTDGSQTLQMTRQLLDQSNYTQVPQLSCGMDIDLDDMTLVI
jgi:hypothetical protein